MPKDKPKKVNLVKVVEVGDELKIPKGVSIPEAIEALQREHRSREQEVNVTAEIEGYLIPDAALAFSKALASIYGYAHQTGTPGFFRDNPPQLIQVRTGPGVNDTVQVPWGGLVVPGLQGRLSVGYGHSPISGRYHMTISATVKRMHKGRVDEIVGKTRQILEKESIYKGTAFSIRLRDDDGDPKPFPEPQFMRLNPALEGELVFNRQVQASIDVNIFTMLEYPDMVKQLGIPPKRGVLLSGKFGTGKTMTSTVVATKAVKNGFTFIKCERATELADVLRLARDYGRAVVFCEDIDRVVDGQRTMDMDDLLNVVDGIESKSTELIVVFTTNDAARINRAMLRPGRLDAVINFEAPDEETVERLFRMYGRGLVADDLDVTQAAHMMKGHIPAIVQEVVEKAKLAAIWRNEGVMPDALTSEDLVSAAYAMANQLELMKEPVADTRTSEEKAASIVAGGLTEAARIAKDVTPVDEAVAITANGSKG